MYPQSSQPRLGQPKSAQDEFLQALQLMADLPEPKRTGFGCVSLSVSVCVWRRVVLVAIVLDFAASAVVVAGAVQVELQLQL